MRNAVVRTAWRSAAVVLALVLSAMPALAQKALVSVKTDQAPTIDGAVDAAWEKAPAYKVALDETPYKPEGFKGLTKTNVTMKSMYDKDSIYLLLQWADPTRSVERSPWVKQPDGKWKQLKAADSTGHDNTYYEDKLGILWNINAAGFDKKGCDIACHKARGGKIAGIEDKSPGRKYLEPGETVDMWHWKAVRTGPVGQVDDQYIDDTKDPTKNADWGRKGDAKTGGGYANNVNKDKTGPAWMNKTPSEENKYWVLDDQKTEFVDTFKPGDVVGGIVIAPFTGSRGDLDARAVWKSGMWTLEIKRKLVTTGEKAKEQDVQFDDLKKTYHFGLSVFDNTQINHVYHEGAHRLTFK